MAFNWLQNISVGASIDNEDFNEIKINLDSIYSYLELTRVPVCTSGAGWSPVWPLQDLIPIQSAHPQEQRDVADYAYDHWCTNHYTEVLSSDYSGEDTSYNAAHDDGYDSGDLGGVHNDDKGGVDNDDKGGYLGGHDSGYDSGDLGGVHNDDKGGYNSGYDSGYDSGDLGGVHNDDKGGYDSGYNSGYNSWYNGGV